MLLLKSRPGKTVYPNHKDIHQRMKQSVSFASIDGFYF